jgi:nucleotide-binding universal stress UspA family protein
MSGSLVVPSPALDEKRAESTSTVAAELKDVRVYQNVLMATDFSKFSDHALRYAISIAQRYAAKLHVFHWLNPTAYRMIGEEAVRTATDAAWRDIQQLESALEQKGLLRGIEHTIRVADGNLSTALDRVNTSCATDLIVIGTHGRTGWRKLLLGSIAEKIFRSATCPVLTVGPHVMRSRVKDDGPHDILFATDFSSQSKNAETYVYSMAEKYGARLTLLHVLEQPSENIVYEKERLQMAKQKLQALIDLHHAAIEKTDLAVKVGAPADAILRTALQKHADLIVMGVHAERMADRLMWPNAYRVVCAAACPVLTVR